MAPVTEAIPPFAWTSWSGDGTLRAGLLLLVGVYLLGVGPIRERYRLAPSVDRRQVASYLAGLALLFVALEGPLHELADRYLFSAHMLQHMLMTLFAPPLLLLGLPDWLIRPLLRAPTVARLARTVTRPLPALLLFNVVFVASHVPALYDVVMRDHNIHIAEHLLFIATATLTWWPIVSPLPELPRLSYPLRMLYVFFQTFSGFIVGAFVVKTREVYYPFYSEAPRTFGLTPLGDQQLGGTLMWVAGGLFLFGVFSAIFFAWANHDRVDDDVVEAPPDRPGARVPVAAGRPAKPALGRRYVVGASPDRARLN